MNRFLRNPETPPLPVVVASTTLIVFFVSFEVGGARRGRTACVSIVSTARLIRSISFRFEFARISDARQRAGVIGGISLLIGSNMAELVAEGAVDMRDESIRGN